MVVEDDLDCSPWVVEELENLNEFAAAVPFAAAMPFLDQGMAMTGEQSPALPRFGANAAWLRLM
jgi:hypothetical protein